MPTRCVAALLLALAVPAGAVPIIDQEALPDASGAVIWHDNDVANYQNFRVDTTGLLVALDVYFVGQFGYNPCDPDGYYCGFAITTAASVVEYAPGERGISVGAFLTGESWWRAQGNGWNRVTFSAPVAVTAGDLLAWRFVEEGNTAFGLAHYDGGELIYSCPIDGCIAPFSPTYIPGAGRVEIPGGTVLDPLTVDYAFRIWIEPAVVPEPVTLSLLALAAGAIGARLGRRR